MRLLLDTQIYLWFVSEPEHLPRNATDVMASADTIYISTASLWEIAIKVRIGKLKADPAELVAQLISSGFDPLPIQPEHVLPVARLPLYHSDPFDRMLVAQAMHEGMKLLTTDRKLPQYSDLVIRV